MPIDIDQLKFLVKSAGQVPDKASQAMAAAAQAAKPAGGIPLPKDIKEESPAEGALSAEQQQREQEKLEQQRRQELESKENEIRGLKHELELEKVEREKMTNRYELDLRTRQEEAKLRAEKEKLEKERLQIVQEKARQDNMFKAEEMRHQATLDKATYKQEADIAKAQAKSMADIARQQAQTLIATNDKARKASDKYYADATARINKEHPSVSPALQSQLDGAIASLGRFKKVHSKQLALPKPGTPPDLTKLAMIKWADVNPTGVPAQNTVTTGPTQTTPPKTSVPSTTSASNGATGAAGGSTSTAASGASSSAPSREEWIRSMNEQVRAKARSDASEAAAWDRANHGVYEGGGSYDAMRGAAYFSNQLARAKENNDQASIDYYTKMLAQSKSMAQDNYHHSERTGNKVDQALYKSYTDQRTTVNDWSSHKDRYTTESQFDRDANAYADAAAQKKHAENGGGRWYQKLWDVTLGGTYSGLVNSVNDMRANMRNADYFGANRFWNTTFDDPTMRAAYNHTIQNHNYSDSLAGDIGSIAFNGAMAGLDIASLAAIPFSGGASAAGWAALKAGAKGALTTAAKQGVRAGAKQAVGSLGRGAMNVTRGLGQGAVNYAKAHPIMTGLQAAGAGYTAYDAHNYEAYNPYTAELNPDMIKMSSAMIPIPGEAPRMVKNANVFTAQTANRYYDAHNLNNEAYYNPAYSSLGKTIGGLISSFTGGLINPYKAINPHDIYLKPRVPISGGALMNRVVTEADQNGNSNVHKVIANAAAEKHSIEEPRNTNGTLRHPHHRYSLD